MKAGMYYRSGLFLTTLWRASWRVLRFLFLLSNIGDCRRFRSAFLATLLRVPAIQRLIRSSFSYLGGCGRSLLFFALSLWSSYFQVVKFDGLDILRRSHLLSRSLLTYGVSVKALLPNIPGL